MYGRPMMLPRMGRRRRQRGEMSPMLLLLLMRIYQQWEALPIKPPVTFGLVGLLVATHVTPSLALPYELDEICLASNRIIDALWFGRYDVVLRRAVLSSLAHADDLHLYYNVGSLLVKGVMLERRMGSQPFLVLVIYSVLASAFLFVLIAGFLERIMGINNGCAVGFSAVLFSMKLVLNYQHFAPNSTDRVSIWGVTVSARHAHWLEIIIASYVNPRSSLTGHAAGALAGLLWTQRDHLSLLRSLRWPAANHYTYAAGTAAERCGPSSNPPPPRRTATYHPTSSDELRRRRVARFSGDGATRGAGSSVRI